MSKEKIIVTTGKRKSSIARATIRKGNGVIRINDKLIDAYNNKYLKMKLLEPITLAGPIGKGYDIDVNVYGGGVNGQMEASRMAIARALLEVSKNKDLENKFIAYDRNMVVYDPRRNEPSKPSRSSDGARRKKQLSKR